MGSRFFGFIDFSINKIILDIFVKKLKKKILEKEFCKN